MIACGPERFGACSGERHPPAELVDGTRATPPSVPLDAPTPQILTKVSVVQPPRERAGTAAGRCLAAARDHVPSGRLVVRIGVSGMSVTFPTASGVNPQISIMSIAYMNAKALAARLT